MCTLSWLPGPDGFVLWHSRDERASRGPGLPPATGETRGVSWIAPRDSDFGGTWAGVNQRGVALALANLYLPLPPIPAAQRVSRGLLMLDLLDLVSAADLEGRLSRFELPRYDPFTLVAVGRDQMPVLFRWDRRALESVSPLGPRLLVTSAGGSPVEDARRELFAALGPTADAGAIERLYRSHPLGKDRSVCLHREEAATRSLTRIEVDAGWVRLIYTPGQPCVTVPLPALELVAPEGSQHSGS